MCKKRYCYLLLVVLLCFVLIFSSACDSDSDSGKAEPVNFEDPAFFDLLKKKLGKDKIYPEDLVKYDEIAILGDGHLYLGSSDDEEYISLIWYYGKDSFEYDDVLYENVPDGTIKSLEDLKYFPSLCSIDIAFHPGIDFNTIPEEVCKKTIYLSIYACNLQNIAFLEKYENLKSVSLKYNNIKDLSPLKDLENVYLLVFDYNEVEDLTPVSFMSGLEMIGGDGNKISDLTPLSAMYKLEMVEFNDNLIQDISPLKELKNVYAFELANNQIKDVSPLKDFTDIAVLDLSGNPITNIEVLSHITNLWYVP